MPNAFAMSVPAVTASNAAESYAAAQDCPALSVPAQPQLVSRSSASALIAAHAVLEALR
ncbi:hypothetical protein [Rhodococcus sp. 077-4]|uniref:hypothetical protein n=1 Tax=Rhodococcus sp. 077-4 TaxID=2789271 RepID=UPI0039F4F140